MVKRPEEWAWSSYRAHTKRTEGPAWLDSAVLHRQLSPRTPRRHGSERYAHFVAQGHGVQLWEEALQGQIYLGGEAFVQRMQSLAAAPDERDAAIALAFVEGGYTQTAIAEKTGLSVSRISRLINVVEAKGKT